MSQYSDSNVVLYRGFSLDFNQTLVLKYFSFELGFDETPISCVLFPTVEF